MPDAYKDERFSPAADLKSGYATRCVLCVPVLNTRDEVVVVVVGPGLGLGLPNLGLPRVAYPNPNSNPKGDRLQP